jgi:hypothetical protein
MDMKKIWIIIFCIGATLSLTFSGLLIYIGAQDNHQGEFYDFQTGVWDIPYLFVFIIPPLFVWSVMFFVGCVIHYGIYRLCKDIETWQ